jgi:20S proteasome subunit alpha 3
MGSRYDRRTTTFNPDGRLLQVEYAIENINQDAPVVGVLAADGVVLAAEKKEISKLFVPTRESGKLYKIDDHIMCSVSGVVADANYLIDFSRLEGQNHLYRYSVPIPVEELVKGLSNEKHVYTQFGSSRPFGVSLMYAGYDRVKGFQLYNSDPSGNYAAYKAHATGKNSVNAISTLKSEYEETIDLNGALQLALKMIAKSMDATTPDASKFEIGVVTKDAAGNVV